MPKFPDNIPPINLRYLEFAIASVKYVDTAEKKLGL